MFARSPAGWFLVTSLFLQYSNFNFSNISTSKKSGLSFIMPRRKLQVSCKAVTELRLLPTQIEVPEAHHCEMRRHERLGEEWQFIWGGIGRTGDKKTMMPSECWMKSFQPWVLYSATLSGHEVEYGHFKHTLSENIHFPSIFYQKVIRWHALNSVASSGYLSTTLPSMWHHAYNNYLVSIHRSEL